MYGCLTQNESFLANFANFQIFKLLVEYEDTSATQRYFVILLLVVKYTFCKRMVMWKECIRGKMKHIGIQIIEKMTGKIVS